jgi:hypothetical protein
MAPFIPVMVEKIGRKDLEQQRRKGFQGSKNKKAFIAEGLSSWAPPAGLEPATL